MFRASSVSYSSGSFFSESKNAQSLKHHGDTGIERRFRDLTQKQLRRGVFRSVLELVKAIEDYIQHHHDHGNGFTWTAKAEGILAKVRRTRA